MTIKEVLQGHTTVETAYVVDDYPYGFRLRCKIRYWLEYAPKKGFRLCSQTTNPKVAYEKWNAPKKSTYSLLAVMGLDEEGHVTWTGVSPYEFSKLVAFGEAYSPFFNVYQKETFEMMVKIKTAYEKRKAEGNDRSASYVVARVSATGEDNSDEHIAHDIATEDRLR